MNDITQASTYLPLIGGVLIPFVVALLTKAHTTGLVKSAVAVASGGLVALAVYVANVNGSHTWKGALTAFVLAVAAAASSRVVVTGGADTKLNQATANFGVGVNTRKP